MKNLDFEEYFQKLIWSLVKGKRFPVQAPWRWGTFRLLLKIKSVSESVPLNQDSSPASFPRLCIESSMACSFQYNLWLSSYNDLVEAFLEVGSCSITKAGLIFSKRRKVPRPSASDTGETFAVY